MEGALGPAVAEDDAGIAASEADRTVEDRHQDAAQIQGRADCLPNLAQRLQFLDRTRQILGALAHFVKQADILNRDHRLVGEGGDQLDLPVGERLDRPPSQADDPDHHPVAQQWHTHIVRALDKRSSSLAS